MNDLSIIQDRQPAPSVTWGELTELEPRLNELLWQARVEGARCRCWQDVKLVFGPIRAAVIELVGFLSRHREHPVLGSVDAYQVADRRLHAAVSGLLPRTARDIQNGCEPRAEDRSDRLRDVAA
jgi:hypothetical protein